jgi:hypothetical protein
MKKLLVYIFLFISATAFPQKGKEGAVQSFVPKGWKIIATTKGDLNKDGAEDIAIVIEDTKKANFKKNTGMGSPELNLNPRQLLILFKNKGTDAYSLIAKADSFIPEANDEENPCLADPLLESGDVTINKGLLVVEFNYWYSCGSSGVSHKTYTFRFQDNVFMLIGYDSSDFNRFSGEIGNISINFLTKKKSITSGENEFGEGDAKPKVVWKAITIDKLIKLQDLNRNSEIEF